MGSRHRAAGGRHAEPQGTLLEAPDRPSTVPPLPPLTSLRVVDEPARRVAPTTTGAHRAAEGPADADTSTPADTGSPFPAFGQIAFEGLASGAGRVVPDPTGGAPAAQGPRTGSRGPATGSRRPAGTGPATGSRRAPARTVRWVPVAVAIWIASFLAVPAAVLVHQAVSSDTTAVDNAADERPGTPDRDAQPDPAGAAGAVAGVESGQVPATAPSSTGTATDDEGSGTAGDDGAVAPDVTAPSAPAAATAEATGAVVATGGSAVPAPSPATAGRSTPAETTTSPAPAPAPAPEPAPQPEPTEAAPSAALAPPTGP